MISHALNSANEICFFSVSLNRFQVPAGLALWNSYAGSVADQPTERPPQAAQSFPDSSAVEDILAAFLLRARHRGSAAVACVDKHQMAAV